MAETSVNLVQISLEAKRGETVVIAGPVGSGKSSIFEALTNQMFLKTGSVEISESVSIAPQEPWLMSGTIRENILFGSDYDAKWYRQVVDVCCLEPDFAELEQGDRTSVGQEGIALSGGQRARIGLARAVYQKSRIILLDDPLSAVDRHVSKKIWNKCIQQTLKDTTVILATHQINYLNQADKIYHIQVTGSLTGSINMSHRTEK